MDEREMFDELLVATRTPKIHHFASLVAGLQQAGCSIIPREYWRLIGKFISQDDGVFYDDFDSWFPGWTVLRNHIRTESHTTWQMRLRTKLDSNQLSIFGSFHLRSYIVLVKMTTYTMTLCKSHGFAFLVLIRH